MIEKVCTKCGATKILTDFAPDRSRVTGYSQPCRECKKISSRLRFRRRLELNREAERQRMVRRNATRTKPYTRSVKELARIKLRDAVRSGRIVKPKHCTKCGSTERIQAHHVDYAKPFDVQWLCSICHGKEHRIPDVSPVVAAL